jgi:gliding motility-associatede transport system auxiliary component
MQKKSIQTILYSMAGVAAMALILIAFNVITGAFRERMDLTKEKAYTLSAGTKAILRKLDTPVKVRFYCTKSQTATPATVYLRDYARRVEDLLAEYKQIAGDKLVIEKLDPQPDSNAEDSARLDGVEGQDMANGEKFYLGLAVSMLDQKRAIPFLDPSRERLLEYDLSRAISLVENPDRPVVGIMSPLPVFGAPANPMMMQQGQPGQPPWSIVGELQNDFTVKHIPMDTDKIDSDVRVLLVIHPRDISDKAQFAIDQFLMRGGKLVAFLDPLPLVDSSGQNPMMGSMPNHGSSLDELLKAWGIHFDTSKVVADMNYKMQLRNGGDAPAFLSVTGDGINQNDIVTSEIDDLWLPFAGAFTGTPVSGLKETVLLDSTTNSELVAGFMAQMSGENIVKDFKSSETRYPLAIRLTGRFKTAFPDGEPNVERSAGNKPDGTNATPSKPDNLLRETREDNTVILVGDADMLYDQFALREIQTPFGNLATRLNGNLNFAQNAVEQLTGDNNLIAVRSRATQNHPFTVIKAMQASAEESYQSKIKDLEDSLADTRQRLNELQQAKQGNQRFILSPQQEAELERFRTKEAEVNEQLKDLRKQLRRDIDSLENRIKWLNIAAMPVLVSVSGLGLAFYKRKRTSAK